jgi:hypothetical protein
MEPSPDPHLLLVNEPEVAFDRLRGQERQDTSDHSHHVPHRLRSETQHEEASSFNRIGR